MPQVNRKLRLKIFERDKWCCFYCGNTVVQSESDRGWGSITQEQLRAWACIDHVTPLNLGGTDHPDNLVTACRLCNGKKGKSTLDEYRTRVARATNGYGVASDLLSTALRATATPFDAAIVSAIEWLESQIPEVVFAGERKVQAVA